MLVSVFCDSHERCWATTRVSAGGNRRMICFQNSMLKLHRSLEKVELESVRHFFNLAVVHIRRELVDLSRHHFGPEGIGKKHHTDQQAPDETGGRVHAIAEEPEDLAEWSEFHQRVDRLPRRLLKT